MMEKTMKRYRGRLTCLMAWSLPLATLHAVEDYSIAARAMRFARTADAAIEEIAIDANMAWHSRYVSEGRDNLDGEGLVMGGLSGVNTMRAVFS